MYTQFQYLCNFYLFTDFILQQYTAISNKRTAVPLTAAHLQSTCSEIVHVQPQSCDHTLNHATINTVFQKWNVFSSSKRLTFILPVGI